MDNQDKTTFSLEDEEIVEEEVIDRDEEYEDEDYGDEEYEDEGDYGDEEYEGEEGDYDDGYNDEYYDDRLNKVLDELAELKRGMVPAAIQPHQPIMPPQYIYQPTAPPAGSEVVMYNEISRLRDEVAKNQSSLEMQKELARIKEDMARDQKFAEAQYNAEIQRLQSKIDDLLKNGSSPQDELPIGESARFEGGNLDMDKLISINEAILRATRDSDAKLQSEIAQLKKQVDDFPSVKELNGAVAAVKKAVGSLDGGINADAIAKLSADLAALKIALEESGGVPAAAVPTAAVVKSSGDISATELLRQLYDIKTAIGNTSADAAERARIMSELVCDYKKVNFDVHSQTTSYKDKLNSAYAYAKKLADCNDPDAVDLISAFNALIAELAAQPLNRAVFGDLTAHCNERGITAITSAIRESAERFFGICQKIESAEVKDYTQYLPDLIAEINTIESNKKEAENAALVGEITTALLDDAADKSTVKDNMQCLLSLKVSDIIELARVETPKSYVPTRPAAGESVLAKLAELKAAVLDRPVIMQSEPVAESAEDCVQPAPAYAGSSMSDDDIAVGRILAAIDEIKLATGADGIAQALEEVRNNYLDIADKIVALSEQIQQPVVAESAAASAASTMSDDERQVMLDDLGYIRSRVDEYESLLGAIPELRNDIANIGVPADSSEQFTTLVSDLTAQFDKLYEDLSNVVIESEANVINRIAEINTAEALETAKADILAETRAVKDAVLNVSDSILAMPMGDALEIAKADILADTQAIREAVLGLSDAVAALSVSDAVDQLRADVNAFVDATAATAQATAADRQRLIDDVAFLREQAELAIAESEQIPNATEAVQDTEKFVEYLDEIAARVTLITSLAEDSAAVKTEVAQVRDDIAALTDTVGVVAGNIGAVAETATIVAEVRDNVAALSENVSAVADNLAGIAEVRDSVAALTDTVGVVAGNIGAVADTATIVAEVRDNVAALTENVSAVTDNLAGIAEVRDSVAALTENVGAVAENINSVVDNISGVAESLRPIADDATAARDAAASTLEAIAPITEQLNAILERLDASEAQYAEGAAQSESSASVLSDDELVELKDGINTILDTLPLFPQADDLVTARDNTFSILDSLALMPQADDVVVTRDNVAAMLESLNVLTDSINAVMATQDTQPIAEEVAGMRETIDSVNDDVKFIRQKLEEVPDDDARDESIAAIMQNIETLLEKIEQYEITAASDKQEIVDTVTGIREEIHISTLDENMSAAGLDGETRDALVGEIAEIRERLGNIDQVVGDINVAVIEGVNAQISQLQTAIKEKLSGVGGDSGAGISDDNMQALVAELSAIREKLDAAQEYDTIEEILSLREDIKAARIVDQDEVTGELESIKNELAAISSGNILDEIRALREDIANLPNGESGTAPTEGELNLVLNEIVSLRDEVFAFKDEVAGATAARQPEDLRETPASNAEDINTILDEITALRADQSALTGNIDELKDMVARRASIVAESEDGEAVRSADELNVVLDEIINLKNDIVRIEENIGGDRLAAISEQVEEIRAALDGLQSGDRANVAAENVMAAEVDLSPIMEQFENLNAAIDDIRLNREVQTMDGEGNIGSTMAQRFEDLHNEIAEIKDVVASLAPTDYAAEMAELRAEIDALRQENEQLKAESTDALSAQIADLKETIRDMALSFAPAPVATESGDMSYAALIDEIRALKEQIAERPAPAATLDEDTLQAIKQALAAEKSEGYGLENELGDIRDEIAQLRSLTAVTAESGGIAEVAAIRDEIAELKTMLSSSDSLYGVAEDVTAIKADVQTLKDEPDLGVMSEILALRDEFQSLREQIEDVKRIAGKTDRDADDSLMNEVQSLRDQLFAISMANVNDPTSGETNYESYNNIILDEIASLRDQVNAGVGATVDLDSVYAEFAQLRSAIEKRDAQLDRLAERVAKLDSSTTDGRILQELAALRTDMASRREADAASLNYMSEMAHLIERQNQYLTQNQTAGSKISDELERLKAEIASSDAVAEEVAKLREIMMQTGNAADNDTILNELAELREELSREKPSRENALVLDAIARLRDEITVLAEREKVRDITSDADLSDSLTDLKEQLNEIAGIVEPAEKKSASSKQTSTASAGKKRGRKPAQKQKSAQKPKPASSKQASTAPAGKKRGRKPKSADVQPARKGSSAKQQRNGADNIDAIIDAQAGMLGGDDDMALNLRNIATADTMDVADKLAKQVANKLIMEQLVEQLGDGGVSEERVDEILRDILPQEFTTIAETEASDKIRRLANRLVLNKLRARLNGNGADDE